MKMKTITFEGKEYEVEDWVNYVATDSNGRIYGYQYEPIKGSRIWSDNGGEWSEIYDYGWKDSLVKV